MQEINQAVDKTVIDVSGIIRTIDKSAMAMRGFIQSLEKNPVKPPSPDLHRKAVAKRKKRKNGGHK